MATDDFTDDKIEESARQPSSHDCDAWQTSEHLRRILYEQLARRKSLDSCSVEKLAIDHEVRCGLHSTIDERTGLIDLPPHRFAAAMCQLAELRTNGVLFVRNERDDLDLQAAFTLAVRLRDVRLYASRDQACLVLLPTLGVREG